MKQYRNFLFDSVVDSDEYFNHVSAMTGEKLHSKSDIAAELAYRDIKIKKLESFHTAKHNRDVELTDLLAELAERYSHVLTPSELGRIHELTKPAE